MGLFDALAKAAGISPKAKKLAAAGAGGNKGEERPAPASRPYAYKKIMADDEARSCVKDVKAWLDQSFRIVCDGGDEDQAFAIEKAMAGIFGDLIDFATDAYFYGYNACEIVYSIDEETGLILPSRAINQIDALGKFTIGADGEPMISDGQNKQPLDKQKWLFMTCGATAGSPYGRMDLMPLLRIAQAKESNLLRHNDFMQSYARPLIFAEVESGGGAPDDVGRAIEKVAKQIDAARYGGVVVFPTGSTARLEANPSDGQAFLDLDAQLRAAIQKYIVGKTKLDALDKGSYAAQREEQKTTEARMGAHRKNLQRAAQAVVDMIVGVNDEYGRGVKRGGGVWFEFVEQSEDSGSRAERDLKIAQAMSAASPIRYTKQYLMDAYGFEEAHLEEAAPEPAPASSGGAADKAAQGSADAKAGGKGKSENSREPQAKAVAEGLEKLSAPTGMYELGKGSGDGVFDSGPPLDLNDPTRAAEYCAFALAQSAMEARDVNRIAQLADESPDAASFVAALDKMGAESLAGQAGEFAEIAALMRARCQADGLNGADWES